MCRYVKSLRFVVLPLFLTIVFGVTGNVQGSKWSRTGYLNKGRAGALSVLLTNGKFMVLGGQYDKNYYEIFDPAIGIWTRDQLPSSCDHHMAMLLPDGKALMVGSPGDIWLYDSESTNWQSSTASFGSWKIRANATLLKNGLMLAINYDGSTNCALYNYADNSIISTGKTQIVHESGATETMLPNGKVLVVGTWPESDICELYDPALKTWGPAGNSNVARYDHLAVLPPPPWNNKVLVIGGMTDPDGCELYDIASSTNWAITDSSSKGRVVQAAALLPSGKVLITGKNPSELYDPSTEKWSNTDSMEIERGHHSLVILPTGKILASGIYGGTFGGDTLCEIYDPSDGKGNWVTKSHTLNTERAAHTVTPLPIFHIPGVCSTNILISGGENSTGVLKSCEVYNYNLDQGALTDSLDEARTHHTAVLLASGEVLVAGGKNGATIRSSSELYDVSTQLWTTTAGAMTDARFDHSATLLENGNDVLVTGGEDAVILNTCEIYNGGNWTLQGNTMTTPRARHTAIILLNGDILVIGGQTTGGSATASCELWNGTSWVNRDSLSTARYLHTATLLQSGKVLVAGGTNNGTSGLLSCEIYDPDLDSWSPEGSLNTARYLHNTTILYSGLVLVTGGNDGITSCEIWDPAAELDTTTNIHKWKDIGGTLADGRAYHSSVLLPIDKPYVFAIGGKNSGGWLNSIERYDVGLGYSEIWQSTITSHSAVTTVSNPINITGTLFRGVSEADGGNHCHIVSNDHPIISLVRIGGGNWQGNGGGELLYMPLSSSWNETHTDVHPPTNAPVGYYRLWSIANGIPCKWYNQCLEIEEKTGIKHKTTGISVSVFPNPATDKIVFHYSLNVNRHDYTIHDSQLTIHDLSGRLVRSLPIHDSRLTTHEIIWDGRDSQGKKVNSGIYFYSIKYKDSGVKGKFVILK